MPHRNIDHLTTCCILSFDESPVPASSFAMGCTATRNYQHQPDGVSKINLHPNCNDLSTCSKCPEMIFRELEREYHTVVMADVGSDHNRNNCEKLPERSHIVDIGCKSRPRDFACQELPNGHTSDDDHEHHRKCH